MSGTIPCFPDSPDPSRPERPSRHLVPPSLPGGDRDQRAHPSRHSPASRGREPLARHDRRSPDPALAAPALHRHPRDLAAPLRPAPRRPGPAGTPASRGHADRVLAGGGRPGPRRASAPGLVDSLHPCPVGGGLPPGDPSRPDHRRVGHLISQPRHPGPQGRWHYRRPTQQAWLPSARIAYDGSQAEPGTTSPMRKGKTMPYITVGRGNSAPDPQAAALRCDRRPCLHGGVPARGCCPGRVPAAAPPLGHPPSGQADRPARPACQDRAAGPARYRRYRGLTARELQVLRLVAVGRSNREISAELFVSVKTVSVHVSGIVG